MKKEYNIPVNIFPFVMNIGLKNENHEFIDGDNIEIPRIANFLYLEKVIKENYENEFELLEKYLDKKPFCDLDYKNIIDIVLTEIPRKNTFKKSINDCIKEYGINICIEDNKLKPNLIEEDIPRIRVETWEFILISILNDSAMDVISCFDFDKHFTRNNENNINSQKLAFNLGSWTTSFDQLEQNLNNVLRIAFIYTIVDYSYGDLKDQYSSFSDFFENEFYKRVSLIFAMWSNRNENKIEYIALYDSFYNLKGIQKSHLINILKAVLDNNNITIDEQNMLKERLILNALQIHKNKDTSSEILKNELIKPVINFIFLREKAKDAIDSAKLLCEKQKYSDCADRCFYAMTFTLKYLLENKNKLSKWKENQLKEAESHKSLENNLNFLICKGVLNENDRVNFMHVKDKRWNCDYSIYIFDKQDAELCIKKAEEFFLKIESITSE
ncbi:MAG: HEPN domain-containing protein [Clostridia bacterium]